MLKQILSNLETAVTISSHIIELLMEHRWDRESPVLLSPEEFRHPEDCLSKNVTAEMQNRMVEGMLLTDFACI